jgi:hypothetical protein
MSRTPRMYGASEVAEALGVHVQNLGFVSGLPEPCQKIRATRLWRADVIDTFAEQYNERRRLRQQAEQAVETPAA